MRKILITLLVGLFAVNVWAQPGMGNRGGGGAQPAGRLYGKIVETTSGKGVEFASVQLLANRMDTVTKQRKEVVIGGMLTKSNGEFSIENVPVFGPLKLKVSAIGFKETTTAVSFDIKPGGDMSNIMNALDKDLGNIKIETEEKVLDNVTVTASKPGLQLGIDRKIFNVDKNIASAGGTAVDIMRNIPSLNVDIDGNVTMRNNSPQLFVDGRPTNLTLDQIPSDAIQSVEMITNPSAKFDASGGTAGILNVVLKKEKKVGYNGNIRANVDSRGRVGGGGDINLRQQKVNMFASGMYMQRKSIATGHTERENFFSTPQINQYQTDRSTSLGGFGFGRAGLDYFISNRNTLSASVNFARGQMKPFSNSGIEYDSLYPSGTTESFQDRSSNSKSNFRNLGATLSFKHNFPKAGREWTADVTYNKGKNNNTNIIETDFYNARGGTLLSEYNQQQLIDGKNSNVVIQTDFVNPITDKSKLEMGLRAQLRTNSSTNSFFFADADGKWIFQPASQVNYKSDDQVYAAYASYSNQIKNFGYQLGLRAESSNYNGQLLTTGEIFKIDFPISLFPSVFLSQKLGETSSIQVNYTRRINRPNFWQLTPFTDSSDRINPSKGNPGLKPEFTNSFELSYEKSFRNKGNFLASIYYKQTTDLITRFQETATGAGGEELLMNTYINANSSYTTGLELTTRQNLTKWWEFTPNFNLYMSDVEIDIAGQADQPKLTSYFAKVNNTFKLPKNISIQLSGDYQSKTILPPGGSAGGGRGGFGGGGMFGGGPSGASQGYIRPTYGVDIAVKYEFLKNRTASVSVNMNDIFRTRVSDVHSESALFVQDAFRRRDPQVLRINFNWRFGKFDANLFKRKNMKGEREGQSGGMDGMQQ
ncbi:TonB-dependent receptor family protein [Terrimonas sp. NA20]|uniref:TonB-dependent receptor family protein n=1 Tax=Terrimonas ginsenosidimutans TaxID=2908004 RepID=A0ABS9KWF1_9BACT|nr:outer membrane beta-barrel family protein [Terrimonas ginsenosidimutans]MCG2616643.1 TonB-dependent receptor family protein [Terrimonas ginsenosidimutans]